VGVIPRDAKRAETCVGAGPEAVGQLCKQCQEERTRAGTEVSDSHCPRARTLGIDRGECSLDDRFRLRPWHECRGIDAQLQTPEFFVADDARDRLMRQSAPGERGNRGFFRGGESTGTSRRERGMIE
jgi:hypothetical protein